MKRFLIILIIPAILFSFLLFNLDDIAYAQQDNIGYDVRGDYKAEIVFGNFSLANGRIVRSFSVTFDKEFLTEFDEDTIFSKQSMFDYVSAFIQAIGFNPEIDDKGRVIGTIIYESATDLYLENEIDGYEENDNDYEKENTFFYTDIYSRQTTIFKGINGNKNSIKILIMQLEIYGLKSQEIALGYHYGTPYKIITSDAEKSYYDVENRIYIHEFQMDLQSANREILIKQRIPNSVNWYLLAIGIAVPFVVIPILIGIYIKKKENQMRGY